MVKEEDVEKHIGGCMAGFFNIFDRPHLLSPKRFSLPKRLSSSSSSSSLKTEPSVLESENHSVYSTPQLRSPAPPEHHHLSEFKQVVVSSRRFSKEAPRLSLDSRAVVDAKGSLKPRQIHTDVGSGSPSVIARLMGLEALPDSQQQPLQRSASESRVISRFVDSLNFQNTQSTQGVEDHHSKREQPSRGSRPSTPVPLRRKSFFDTADFFPEPRQILSRGSSDADSDLETLKQLLEAHRLKGLLHSNRNVIIPPQSPPIRSVTYKRDLSKGKTRRTSENSVKTPNKRPTLKESWRAEHVNQTRNRSSRLRPVEDEHEEVNKHGKTLLERCDKLLHSIAEMEAAAGDSQPSPVSVLDASLYHEDSSPSSPVMKRTLHFTELLLEDESFLSSSSDSEYDYISDILRASNYLPLESDIFLLLEEKQQYSKCASSALERRLTFDLVQEIIGRIRRRGRRMVGDADEMLELTWSVFQKLKKKRDSPPPAEDLVGYVCGVLGRDLSEDPWREFQVEMSEAVLVIERLLFKDLIGETISHMAALNRSASLRRRRRLFF
ncbi:Zinc finger CCCH domain protein [Hirschfeldia incana]|nr:Zinc finger CCCH domain protein [Hirschfeldia incana]